MSRIQLSGLVRALRFWPCGLLAAPAAGQVVELGVTQVDASPLGSNYVTADVYINVLDEADWWTIGGILGDMLVPGLAHYILRDPNDRVVMTAPGNQTPQQEFATFVGLPREQFSPKRFGPNGAAGISRSRWYEPVLEPEHVDLVFLQFPPSADGGDVPDTGFIVRVTLENGPLVSGYSTDGIVVAASPAPGVLLASYSVGSATKLVPSPLGELEFGFYWIPEPASAALLALGAALACWGARRRVAGPAAWWSDS